MSKEKKFYLLISFLVVVTSILLLTIEGLFVVRFLALQDSFREREYQIQKTAEKEEILSQLQYRYQEIENYLPIIEATLPSKKNVSKILTDIDGLAEDSGVKLTEFEPYNKQSNSKTSSQNPKMLQIKKGKFSYELPLKIEVSGSYSKIIGFINRLESYQRLVEISELSIEKEEGAAADYVVAIINLTSYVDQ